LAGVRGRLSLRVVEEVADPDQVAEAGLVRALSECKTISSGFVPLRLDWLRLR
jgi:hypothetical protein